MSSCQWNSCLLLLNFLSYSFEVVIDESLHFPGPQLEACEFCFQRSKDDAGDLWFTIIFLAQRVGGNVCI
ncbi:hypothetical protein BDE02_18G025800 [Populus trichocarpa]|nr:hypothetical protein BDE02_18G025800 [Populus trichocarpa]